MLKMAAEFFWEIVSITQGKLFQNFSATYGKQLRMLHAHQRAKFVSV